MGCSEDGIQPTTLDSDLYGLWDRGNYILTLSSNGKFMYLYENNNSGDSGDWWVEGNYLILQYNSNDYSLGDTYSVDNNELSYLGYTWYR